VTIPLTIIPKNVAAGTSVTRKPVLLCFSHLRWRFVYQRPQHLMTRAGAAWTVYFIEEPIYDEATETPRIELSSGAPGITIVVPVLPPGLPAAQARAVEEAAVDLLMARHRGSVTAFWYYTPRAVSFTLAREPDLVIYDCMDELQAFKGAAPELASQETTLFALADLVFTGGRALFESKRQRHPQVHLFPSSVDKRHFAKARSELLADPSDQASIPHPRIGFFGVIDERFDVDLTARLADRHPDWHFVLIGPVVKIDAGDLPRRPNLHWLGRKNYAALPGYLAHWDVGFMPFAMNDATRFISPTKTPEFLAAGLPVVSSPVRDVVRDWGDPGLVQIGRTPAEFSEMISTALASPRRPWLAEVDRCLASLSWDDTWRRMSKLMLQELNWRVQSRRLLPELADAENV
jgi:glycosyltransferase involved in cell wall biosynthesis